MCVCVCVCVCVCRNLASAIKSINITSDRRNPDFDTNFCTRNWASTNEDLEFIA